jgi:hypothetical protein
MRTAHGQPLRGLPVCSRILLPASGLVTSHKTGLEFWGRRVLAEYSRPSSSAGICWSLICAPLIIVMQTTQYGARDDPFLRLLNALQWPAWDSLPEPLTGSRVVELRLVRFVTRCSCRSLKSRKWSRHSRRTLPRKRSQTAFAFGAPYGVRNTSLRCRKPLTNRYTYGILWPEIICYGVMP